ncbi:hypothetical protein I552_8418 [Mycobacterium xenopi 3993]|nr:hypothetical protein I552_8418 [Mycobacterium xenopi 3993]
MSAASLNSRSTASTRSLSLNFARLPAPSPCQYLDRRRPASIHALSSRSGRGTLHRAATEQVVGSRR